MDSSLEDDRLRLIFTCCHPALAPEAQVALTLRTLGGLNTSEIARAFLVPTSTLAQRLVRAKRKIPAFARARKDDSGWLTLTDAAKLAGISPGALRKTVDRGEIEAEHPLADSPWIFQRTQLESPEARAALHQVRLRRRNGPAVHDSDDLNLFKSSNYSDGAV